MTNVIQIADRKQATYHRHTFFVSGVFAHKTCWAVFFFSQDKQTQSETTQSVFLNDFTNGEKKSHEDWTGILSQKESKGTSLHFILLVRLGDGPYAHVGGPSEGRGQGRHWIRSRVVHDPWPLSIRVINGVDDAISQELFFHGARAVCPRSSCRSEGNGFWTKGGSKKTYPAKKKAAF